MTRLSLSQYIINLLKKHHLLSAPEIQQILTENSLKYNKTSIYRALDKLFINQIVCRHSMGSNQIVFALKSEETAHLVCQCCGAVHPIKTDGKLDIKAYQTPEFAPDHFHLTIFGRCNDCYHEKKPKKVMDLHLA